MGRLKEVFEKIKPKDMIGFSVVIVFLLGLALGLTWILGKGLNLLGVEYDSFRTLVLFFVACETIDFATYALIRASGFVLMERGAGRKEVYWLNQGMKMLCAFSSMTIVDMMMVNFEGNWLAFLIYAIGERVLECEKQEEFEMTYEKYLERARNLKK